MSTEQTQLESYLGEYRVHGPFLSWGGELTLPVQRAEHVLSRQAVALGCFELPRSADRPGNDDVNTELSRTRTAWWDRALRLSHVDHHGLSELVESCSPDQQSPFLAWHLDTGRTLRERIGSPDAPGAGRLLRPEEALRIVSQIAEGLGALHRAEEIHGVLCPANVLLRPGGAQMLAPGWGTFNGRSQDAGSAEGWCYRAPEQLPGGRGPIGPAVDVWALGAILWELLHRHPMWFPSDVVGDFEDPPATVRALGARCSNEDALTQLTRTPTISALPETVQQLIAGLLNIRPAARPRAEQLLAPLGAAMNQLSPRQVARQTSAPVGENPTGASLAASASVGTNRSEMLPTSTPRPQLDDWRGTATWFGDKRRELAAEEDPTPLWLIWLLPLVGLGALLGMVVLVLSLI